MPVCGTLVWRLSHCMLCRHRYSWDAGGEYVELSPGRWEFCGEIQTGCGSKHWICANVTQLIRRRRTLYSSLRGLSCSVFGEKYYIYRCIIIMSCIKIRPNFAGHSQTNRNNKQIASTSYSWTRARDWWIILTMIIWLFMLWFVEKEAVWVW